MSVEKITILILTTIFSVVVHCEQNAGDLCTIKSIGKQGTCKPINDCPQAFEDIFIQACDTPGTVCCQNNQPRIPGEMSKQKCREFSKYVSDDDKCGQVTAKQSGKQPAAAKEFPHVVVLGFNASSPGDTISWQCGGTIISDRYILTVAHCVKSLTSGPVQYVKMGITNLTDESEHQQQYTIAERITHPNYKFPSFYDDIALLKLAETIKFNEYVRPACLNTRSEVSVEDALGVAWGNSGCGSVAAQLVKETLRFHNHTVCSDTYNDSLRGLQNGISQNKQFCAGPRSNTLCDAVSGGPLQIFHDPKDAKCMYDVVGVASFGKGFQNTLDGFTRISYYIKWIEDIVWPQTS